MATTYRSRRSRMLAARARFALILGGLFTIAAAGMYLGGGWISLLPYVLAGVGVLAATALACYLAISRIETGARSRPVTVAVSGRQVDSPGDTGVDQAQGGVAAGVRDRI